MAKHLSELVKEVTGMRPGSQSSSYPGSLRDPIIQRALLLRQKPRCDHEWTTKSNDEFHLHHTCKGIVGHATYQHHCNCGSSQRRK